MKQGSGGATIVWVLGPNGAAWHSAEDLLGNRYLSVRLLWEDKDCVCEAEGDPEAVDLEMGADEDEEGEMGTIRIAEPLLETLMEEGREREEEEDRLRIAGR